MAKRFTDNDKYASRLRFKVNNRNDLNDIMNDLLDACNSDFVMHNDDKLTLIFDTVHYHPKWGWDNVDGSQAKKSDLGGYTLNMIDKLAMKTDIVDMWYPKDGHVGVHFHKHALSRRLNGSIKHKINTMAGADDRYIPQDDRSFDDWVDDQRKYIVF